MNRRLAVSILVDKVKGHGDRSTQRPKSQRVDLRVDEVLNRVPAQCPTKTGEIDHDNGAHGCMLLAGGLWHALVGDGLSMSRKMAM